MKDHDYLSDPSMLTEFSKHIITYMIQQKNSTNWFIYHHFYQVFLYSFLVGLSVVVVRNNEVCHEYDDLGYVGDSYNHITYISIVCL